MIFNVAAYAAYAAYAASHATMDAYKLSLTFSLISDNDECKLGTHHCGLDSICINMQGSFRCEQQSCRQGYRMSADGRCEYIACEPGYETDQAGSCVGKCQCQNQLIMDYF